MGEYKYEDEHGEIYIDEVELTEEVIDFFKPDIDDGNSEMADIIAQMHDPIAAVNTLLDGIVMPRTISTMLMGKYENTRDTCTADELKETIDIMILNAVTLKYFNESLIKNIEAGGRYVSSNCKELRTPDDIWFQFKEDDQSISVMLISGSKKTEDVKVVCCFLFALEDRIATDFSELDAQSIEQLEQGGLIL